MAGRRLMMFAVMLNELIAVELNKMFAVEFNKLTAVEFNKLTVLFYNLAVTIPLVMFNPDRGNLVANDEEDRPHNAKELSGNHICHQGDLHHRAV